MKAKTIPEGFHSPTPYMVVCDVAAAVEFYKRIFDPFGHSWMVGTHMKDISDKEIEAASKIMFVWR